MDQVVEFAYCFDSTEPGTGHHERQKFLAHVRINLHVGCF